MIDRKGMPSRKGPPRSRAEKKAEAGDALAAFLAAGGQVKTAPAVEARTFACANCGHVGVLGVAAGKKPRCPRCKEPLG